MSIPQNVISLGYTPRPWQREVHGAFRAGKRFVVCVTHRRGGKTKAAIMQLVDGALKSTREGSLFAYVAPYLVQARRIGWSELKRTVADLGPLVVEISESELTVTFRHNGARVALFGADNADALRGLRLDGVVVDEVAFIKPEVWTDVLQPSLADRRGWALFIGTPSGMNLFSEMFFGAASRPDWAALRFDCYSTDALPADEVARMKRDMPEQTFAREMLCDFSASGDDQLISLSDAEAAAHRVYRSAEVADSARIVGVDPARFGDDRSVIFQRQGLQAFPPIVLRGQDNMQLASRVASVIQDWHPDAVFIDSGAGAGVIDRLRQLGFVVIEVPFGGQASKPELFVNRRTEMWVTLAEWLRSGGAIPNDPVLKAELATPVYSFDASGKKKLESKDQIRKRLTSGSPDLADALALTFAAPVASPRAREPIDVTALGFHYREGVDQFGRRTTCYLKLPRREPRSGFDYDPFAFLDQ